MVQQLRRDDEIKGAGQKRRRAGVAAAICGMSGGFLPPTINLEEADPDCDLDYVANSSVAKSVEVSLCNCIGFGSKNSALVIGRGDVP